MSGSTAVGGRERSGRWTHFRTCNLCEAMCGLAIELEDEHIVSIRGDDDDPFSRGHICPKAVALMDVYSDPDRLRHPVRKTSSGWRTIAWEEAFDLVATGLRRTAEQHGRDAVGLYLGNPNVHNLGSMLVGSVVKRMLRTRNVYSATSIDQLPHHFAARLMFGHYFLLPVPDLDRTDYLLILGANPVASNGSILTAPGIARRLDAIRDRGGRIVVVDPRRTETADRADRHLYIQPGRDVLLLLAIVETMFREKLANPGRLADFTDGIDKLAAAASRFPPERVAAALGIEPSEIRRLARELATADRAACYGRIGVSTQEYGGICQWLINAINVVTGNLDRPGGSMFTTPAFDIAQPQRAGKLGRWTSRVRGLPEFLGELPVAALSEEISTPGDGQIRALLTVAGNPALSTPDGRALNAALEGLDFMASIDIYVNETTRHADVILPPTTGLECEHYDVVFHSLAVRNTAKYSPALFAGAEGSRHDWQIFRELARRLASDEIPFDERDPRNAATPAQILDFGLRSGPYRLSLDQLRESPHGIDLGPLEPRLPARLATENQRIALAPEAFLGDLERVDKLAVEPAGNGGRLMLIGRRDLRTNNSWMHNCRRLVKGPARCTVMIHPSDAERLGVRDGQLVVVESRVGRIDLPAQVTDAIKRGVVSIPHGWGHGRPGVRLRVATEHAGSSINDLTDGSLIDELTGNAAVCGVPVEISPVGP